MSDLFPVPTWSLISNPYHYLQQGKQSLLITVGDSWTYGDSIGKTKVRLGIDDTKHRLDHVYGRLLADRMCSDWINLALPGGSNLLIISWLDKLLASINGYDSIICVITLSESRRHEELNLINSIDAKTQQMTLDNILTITYQHIHNLQQKYTKVHFLSAHNFTDCAVNTDINLANKSWLEVLLDRSINNNTRIVVSEHIEQMNYVKKFPDRIDIIELASQRIGLLDNCIYCNSGDTRHPNEQGHFMWAEYLKSIL